VGLGYLSLLQVVSAQNWDRSVHKCLLPGPTVTPCEGGHPRCGGTRR
jgi:hypothetical protein